ncbi:MAG: glutamate--tRNA ligase family protein [Candidatus Micrarchaeota archaeon]
MVGIGWAEETFTSDRMPEIYRFAARLIETNYAYVCTCTQEQVSQGRTDGKPCACRKKGWGEHLRLWNQMLENTFKEGEAILRFKGDLESLNTVMRDPALARIIEKKHYKQNSKYRVWPGYDLAVAVMDHLEGITHPMRTKEYELRNELYYAIFDALNFKRPVLIEFARLSIKNAPVGKRLIRPLVEDGKVMGWDDPRLPTLAGLKRRGLLPEAIKKFVLSFGLSKVESEPDWEALLSENRKLLDSQADHYFFVENPVKIVIKGLERQKAKLKLHPKQDKGFRELEVTDTLFISKTDAEALEDGEIFRLKDLCNAKLLKKGKTLEAEFAGDELVPKKLQWVPEKHLECEVLKPGDLLDEKGEYNPKSLEKIKGFSEISCKGLKEGDIIQFERFGFCRLDKSGEKLEFIFSC